MNPKLSVVIPIYNVEPYLRQCLDSVVDQTYKNLEIILVDDGSPDNCGAICDEYAARDARVSVLHKKNGGLSAARNDGIRRATGEWIAFVDSDDWCSLDYFERLFSEMGDMDVDVFCGGGQIHEDENGSAVTSVFTERFFCDTEKELDALVAKVLCGRCCSIGTNKPTAAAWDKLYRTGFIKDNELLFDTNCKAWEDILFCFQVFDKAGSIGGCGFVGYHYRWVGTSIVNRMNPDKPVVSYYFLTKINEYIEGKRSYELFKLGVNSYTLVVINNLMTVDYFHPANHASGREIKAQIMEMRMMPYYHDAIYSRDGRYLSIKKNILRHMLRLPWIWPLKLIYTLNEKVLKR